MKKYYYLFGVIIISLLLFIIFGRRNTTYIDQEAFPIRESDTIIGLDYILKLDNIKDNTIIIKSNIFDSINHYKDINSINNFLVSLKIENNTKYNYLLKSISLVNKSGDFKINDINFKKSKDINTFEIKLNEEDFSYYKAGYDIQVELER